MGLRFNLDQRLWVVQDTNWNVTALLNDSGIVIERYAYDAYGAVTILDAAWAVKSGGSDYAIRPLWQGLRLDDMSGLYHARNREVSATLGRPLQRDPIGFAAGDVNVYRWLGNGPTGAVDPWGLFGIGFSFFGGLIAGGAGEVFGIVEGLWGLVTTPPWDTISNIYHGMNQLRHTLMNEGLVEFLAEIEPGLAKLFSEWDTIGDYEAGELIGAASVKYGATFIGGAGAAKLIEKLRALKKTKKSPPNVPAAGNPVRGRLQCPFDQRCFPADTPVATEAGYQSISRLERGMKVWACDPDTGNWSMKPVLNTFSHAYEGDVIAVGVAGTVFRATGNHPVWVVTGEGLDQRDPPEHTPASSATGSIRGRWVEARGLRVGDRLLLRDGDEAAVESLVVSQETLRVYNLEVAEDHTYAVGTAGVLVHNKPLEFINLPDAPVGKLTKLNDAWFNERGLAGEQHALKDAVGARPNAHFDIFKDRDGNLWVIPKSGTGEPQWTARWIDD